MARRACSASLFPSTGELISSINKPAGGMRLAQRFREALQRDYELLKEAHVVLRDHVPRARATIAQAARTLREASAAYGYEDVARASAALEQADESVLLERLEDTLGVLHRLLDPAGALSGPKVLFVGDAPELQESVRATLAGLRSGLVVAHTAERAEERLLRHAFGLILIHMALPDSDGRALLQTLRADPHHDATPICMLSVPGAPFLEEECRALGADGYCTGPPQADVLRHLLAPPDTDEQHAGDREGTRSTRTDALSGLLKRSSISRTFERAKSMARSADFPLAFAVFRVHELPAVHELHGDEVYTLTVRRLGHMLESAFEQSDLCVRWSDREFAALLLNYKPDRLLEVADRFLRHVADRKFRTRRGIALRLTASSAVVDVTQELSLTDVVARADRLLAAGGERPGALLSDFTPADPPTRTLLLATPDEMLPTAVRHLLEAQGFDVLQAASLRAAAEAAAAAPRIDVALIDADLEGPGGSPLPALHRLPALRQTPAVILVARGDARSLADGFRHGATDFLTRPFSASELVGRLNFVLKQQTFAAPVHAPPAPTPLYESEPARDVPAPDALPSFHITMALTPSDSSSTPPAASPASLPNASELVRNALIQAIRTRLVKGEPVSVPGLGRLEVSFRPGAVRQAGGGRLVLLPPRRTVDFQPEQRIAS